MQTPLAGGAFFESPRWRDGGGGSPSLFRKLVVAVDDDGDAEEIVHVDGMPASVCA